MKDNYYFQHDYNARNDEKILVLRAKYGAEGYGVFWMILEFMAEATLAHFELKNIPALAVSLNIDATWLEEFINFCINDCRLFLTDGEVFISKRMVDHKVFRNQFKEYGKKGAKIRWNDLNNSPPIAPPNSDPNAKERKGKERKINNSACMFEKVWLKYPKRVGKKLAEKHFQASVKNELDLKRINKALTNYLGSRRVLSGFVQNGSTWFNNWEDWVDYKEEVCKKCKDKGSFISATGYNIICDCPAGQRI